MYGRATYELMAGIWCDMPKFLFSRTVTQSGWNTSVIRDVVPGQIAEPKAQSGDVRP